MVKSGTELKSILKTPLLSVCVFPTAIIFSLDGGNHGRRHPYQHQTGNSATRRTVYFTSALSIFAPE